MGGPVLNCTAAMARLGPSFQSWSGGDAADGSIWQDPPSGYKTVGFSHSKVKQRVKSYYRSTLHSPGLLNKELLCYKPDKASVKPKRVKNEKGKMVDIWPEETCCAAKSSKQVQGSPGTWKTEDMEIKMS